MPNEKPSRSTSAAATARGWQLFASLLILLATTISAAYAASDPIICNVYSDPAKQILKEKIELKPEIGIPLDDTGIADQRLVNPRRPLPILQRALNQPFPAIWDSCSDSVYKIRLLLINRTARSFGVQFNLVIPDAKEEVEAAYKKLLAQVLKAKPTSGSSTGPLGNLLTALTRPSSEAQSCQAAIARLDPAPSTSQADDLETSCVTELQPMVDAASNLIPRGVLKEMGSAIERVKHFQDPATTIPPAECKYDMASHALRCSPKIIVPPGARVPVPSAIVTAAPQSGLLTFTVSFADTADIPSNSTGYLQTAKEWEEPPDSTQWRYSAQLGASWDPDTGKSSQMKMFSADQPYAGETLQHLVGAGNLKLSQKLGNRASATATLGFKKGDLGEKDTTRQVTVPEYTLNVYGEAGVQLLFGKYNWPRRVTA